MFLKLILKCPLCKVRVYMIKLPDLLSICDAVFKNGCCVFCFHCLKMVNGNQLAFLVYQCFNPKQILPETIGIHHTKSESNLCDYTCQLYFYIISFQGIYFFEIKLLSQPDTLDLTKEGAASVNTPKCYCKEILMSKIYKPALLNHLCNCNHCVLYGVVFLLWFSYQ